MRFFRRREVKRRHHSIPPEVPTNEAIRRSQKATFVGNWDELYSPSVDWRNIEENDPNDLARMLLTSEMPPDVMKRFRNLVDDWQERDAAIEASCIRQWGQRSVHPLADPGSELATVRKTDFLRTFLQSPFSFGLKKPELDVLGNYATLKPQPTI